MAGVARGAGESLDARATGREGKRHRRGQARNRGSGREVVEPHVANDQGHAGNAGAQRRLRPGVDLRGRGAIRAAPGQRAEPAAFDETRVRCRREHGCAVGNADDGGTGRNAAAHDAHAVLDLDLLRGLPGFRRRLLNVNLGGATAGAVLGARGSGWIGARASGSPPAPKS